MKKKKSIGKKKKKVLLISPSSAVSVYKEAKVKDALEHMPYLSLAYLGAMLIKHGHEVKVLDLSLFENPRKELFRMLDDFQPDYVGISFTTPLYDEMRMLSKLVKEYDKNIIVIGGGPHSSVLPRETLIESDLDIVVIGEGDYTIVEIVSGKSLSKIKGIAYKKKKKISGKVGGKVDINITQHREFIKDMDKLPLPEWSLFDLKKYYVPRLRAKKNPVGPIETSRGCPFSCTFCNKSIHGITFRPKSPKRVADEIEHMLDAGFKEIHVKDDGFTTNIDRANKICDLIINRELEFPWNLANGVRVDRVNKEFFVKAEKAGCHSSGVGIESGSQKIIDSLNKQITLDMVRRTVRLFGKSGIESIGYFIIGAPADTEKTIKQTIKFALSLKGLDMAKATVFMPFPGTPSFIDLEKRGYILSKNWTNYNYHSSDVRKVFRHPNLSWSKIYYYHSLFHRRFYFRPSKMIEVGWKSFKDRTLGYKLKATLKTKW